MNHYANSAESAKCKHACVERGRTYQSYCVCLCAVNDFPRPPALCGPPRLRPGRNKKRIVRAGEQLRKTAEGDREEEGRG